ncbi:MAG: hypothetical protein PHV62_08095 [Sulfuricurvum sp.]|nr:hypothetical protein [Sulfuricurvum sp.]
MSQLDPIVNQPFLYVNGLSLLNNATTPNTKLDVLAGQCRDSNNMIDINLGNYLNQGNQALTANSNTTINFGVNGANGLDTGSIAASTFYYIYAVADSSNKNQPAALASTSASAPVLPQGYDSLRVIGVCKTDGSSHILAYYVSGSGSGKYFQWDAPIAVTVTSSGTSATYSAMDLSVGVPASKYSRVSLKYKWTPNAAADALNFTPSGATGDFETILGIVAAVAQEDNFVILPLTVSSVPKVSYKTSAGTLNNVFVQAFEMQL